MLTNADTRRIFRKIDKPVPFTVDLVEFDAHVDKTSGQPVDGFLVLRFYDAEILKLPEPIRVKIGMWLTTTRQNLADTGVKCYVEGIKGEPPRRAH